MAAAVVRVALSAESEEVKHLINADQLAGHLRTVDLLAGLDPKQIEVALRKERVSNNFYPANGLYTRTNQAMSSILFCQGVRTFR